MAEKVASLLKTDVLICRTGGIIYLYQNGTNLYHESLAVNVLDKEMGVMVLNAFFNNISVISWQSVLLVEKTGVPGEIH
jgi:hypothetical protein